MERPAVQLQCRWGWLEGAEVFINSYYHLLYFTSDELLRKSDEIMSDRLHRNYDVKVGTK